MILGVLYGVFQVNVLPIRTDNKGVVPGTAKKVKQKYYNPLSKKENEMFTSLILTKVLVDAPQSMLCCRAFRSVFLEDPTFVKAVKLRELGVNGAFEDALCDRDWGWCLELLQEPDVPAQLLKWAMREAAHDGHAALCEAILLNDPARKNTLMVSYGLEGAARGGYNELCESFVSMNANVHFGLRGAARGGHKDLCRVFIAKGAGNVNWGLEGAAEGGHENLCSFFIGRGADVSWGLEGAARGGHVDLCDWFMSKGANVSWGLEGAAQGGRKDLCDLFIRRGANKDFGLRGASLGGHKDLCDVFLALGAGKHLGSSVKFAYSPRYTSGGKFRIWRKHE